MLETPVPIALDIAASRLSFRLLLHFLRKAASQMKRFVCFCSSSLLAIGSLFFSASSAAAQAEPIKAEPVHLLADVPSASYHALTKPISIEFLIAGMRARDSRLKSGSATTETSSYQIGPYADAVAADTAQPNTGRLPGEKQTEQYTTEWRMSGQKLSYRYLKMSGNNPDVVIYSSRAAAYNGREYRTKEVYRADGLKHAAVAPTPAAFVPFYFHDPRIESEVWLGHLSTLITQLQKKLPAMAQMRVSGTETVFGARCYRLDVKFNTGDAWYLWLDIEHDLLIRHEETINIGHKGLTVANVPSLVFSNGVWMAKSADQAEYSLAITGQYVCMSQYEMTVKDFVANQPIADSEFNIALEPGTFVDEVAKGHIYQVPTTPQPSHSSAK